MTTVVVGDHIRDRIIEENAEAIFYRHLFKHARVHMKNKTHGLFSLATNIAANSIREEKSRKKKLLLLFLRAADG